MPDRKPPRLEGDERRTLHALLQYQRESLVRKVTGVSEEDARTPVVASGTTLLWLTRHMAHAESLWVLRRFAGRGVAPPRDAGEPGDTLAAAVEDYRRTWAVVDTVVSGAPSLEERCADVGGEAPVNLRWVLMHLLEETARHGGHPDILRELIDGRTGR